jgi:predicted amidohydrolase
MRKFVFLFIICIFAAVAGWIAQRPTFHYLSDLRSEIAINAGEARGHGNLLAIQPELFTLDYQTPERLRLKLEGYLVKAQQEGLLNDKTIVVFPEHIGTGLMLTGEKSIVYNTSQLDEARRWLAFSNPVKFARAWLTSKSDHRFDEALLRMKAWDMAGNYQVLFGGLARQFSVTVVAGSILLPSPRLKEGLLQVGTGKLYNTCLVFGRDGYPLAKPYRSPWLLANEHHEITPQVLETAAGKLGIVLGTDALNTQAPVKTDILAIPALNERSTLDISQALQTTSAKAGVQVFANGHVWGVHSTSQSKLMLKEQPILTPLETPHGGAKLLNLWL